MKRGLVLIRAKDTIDRQTLADHLTALEARPEVEAVEPVIGLFDAVVRIESSTNLADTADALMNASWVEQAELLRSISLADRFREARSELVTDFLAKQQ